MNVDLKQLFKNLLLYILIVLFAISIIWYCSNKIDKNKKEEKERNERIEQGNCEFNRVNLESFDIVYNKFSHFKPVLNLDTLRRLFSDQLNSFKTSNDSSQNAIHKFRISNTEFDFYQRENLAAIKSIKLDFSSPFKFQIDTVLLFLSSNKLSDFETIFPGSYACCEKRVYSLRSEYSMLKVENSNEKSHLKYFLLYFRNSENMALIEFYYDFEIDGN